MPLIKIAGFLHTFTDGFLLLVPEHSMPFPKEPKKVLHDFEAEFYIGSPLYSTIVEVRVDAVADNSIDAKRLSLQGLDQKLVTILSQIESRPSRGIDQPWLIAQKVVTHGDIADRAYKIHLSRQGGLAAEDWLRAEDALLAERASL